MTGIVLAGGENRRMGTDKAFLAVGGKPMIEHILGVLRRLFPRIIIVTNSPERYSAYHAAVVRDVLDVRGPLTGIYTGLMHSSDEYNFIVACDMPFLDPGLMSFMMQAAEGHDAVVPRIAGLPEPLHAVYRKSLVPVIERSISQGNGKIQAIFDGVNVRYITEQEIDRFDPQRRSFKNLNTPQEYKEAVCSDLECRN